MNITWKIESLDRRSSDGFVTKAHWRATITDADYLNTVCNVCTWFDGQPTIAYENLTEENVLDWCWNQIDKTSIEQELNVQLNMQKNPPILSGKPWV